MSETVSAKWWMPVIMVRREAGRDAGAAARARRRNGCASSLPTSGPSTTRDSVRSAESYAGLATVRTQPVSRRPPRRRRPATRTRRRSRRRRRDRRCQPARARSVDEARDLGPDLRQRCVERVPDDRDEQTLVGVDGDSDPGAAAAAGTPDARLRDERPCPRRRRRRRRPCRGGHGRRGAARTAAIDALSSCRASGAAATP